MKSIATYLFVFLLLSSCSEPLYQLRTTATDYKPDGGKEIVRQAKNGIRVVTSFDGEFQDFLVFDTEFFNETNEVLQLNPSDFVAYPLDKNHKGLPNAYNAAYDKVYSAADPDFMIAKAEQDMKKAKRRHTLATVLNVVLLVANAASDISSSSKPQSHHEWRNNRVFHETNYQLLYAKQAIDDATYHSRMQRLSHARGNWQEEPFRKRSLQPGESVRGWIYIPKHREAAYWRLVYPLENDEISFEFAQTQLKRKDMR